MAEVSDWGEAEVPVTMCFISCFEGEQQDVLRWLTKGEPFRVGFSTGGAYSQYELPLPYRGERRVLWRAGHAGAVTINGEPVGSVWTGDEPAEEGYALELAEEGGQRVITLRELSTLTPEIVRRIDGLAADDLTLSLQFSTGLEGIDLSALALLAGKLKDLSIVARFMSPASVDLSTLPSLPSLRGLSVIDEYGGATVTGVDRLSSLPALERLELRVADLTAGDLAVIGRLRQLEVLRFASEKRASGELLLPDLRGLTGLKRLELDLSGEGDRALGRLKGLEQLTQLQVLELEGLLSDGGLARLGALPELRRLRVRVKGASAAGLAHLARLSKLTALDCSFASGQRPILEPLSTLSSLRSLTLSYEGGDDRTLLPLAKLTGLRTLVLSTADVTEAGLVHIGGLKALENLWLDEASVRAEGPDPALRLRTLTDVGAAHLGGLEGLQRLSLAWTEVGDAGLGHLAGLTKLRVLDLSGTKLTDAGVAHLSGLTELEELSLMGTGITDSALEHLSGLSKLTRLELNSTAITGRGLVHLKGLASLEVLKAMHSRLTGDALDHLEGFERLYLLEVHSSDLEPEAVEGFTARHPACLVVY